MQAQPEANVAQRFQREMGHVSRQSSVYFAGTIFTAAAGYLFKVYLARVLGAEELGIFALGMTIIGLVGIFAAAGLPQASVRFVAMYMASGKMNALRGFLGRSTLALLGANLLFGAVVFLVGPWIAVRFYHTPALIPYLGLFVFLMVLGSFNSFLGQILAGFKDVARRTLITNFVGSPLMMIFTLALVGFGLGLWGYIFAQVASAVVVLIALLVVCWKLTPTPARSFASGIPGIEKEVLWFSAATFGMTFLEFLLGQADKILIGFYLNAREVGIYSVAAALVIFVPIILQSVNQIFSPTIAALHSRGEHELLGRMFQTLTKWILGFTVPLAAVMAIFSRPLMSIFGNDFAVGWAILMIGALGQLVNCGTGSVGFLLLMSGNQRRLIQIQAVMALVMVGMNLALIPHWGITGAAVAAAATNVLSNIWYLWAVHDTLGLFPYNRSYFRLAVPIGATLAALFLLRFESGYVHHNWLLVAMALVAGYLVFTAVALMAGLDSDDRIIADAVWYKVRGLLPGAEGKA